MTEAQQPKGETKQTDAPASHAKEPFHETEMRQMYRAGEISQEVHFGLRRQFTAGFGGASLFELPDKTEALGIAEILAANPDLIPPQAAKIYRQQQEHTQKQQKQPTDEQHPTDTNA